MKKISYPFLYLLYFLSFLSVRNKNIWLFGSYKNSFSDNSKYLFLHVSKNYKDIKAIWISGDKVLVKRLREKGYSSFYKFSLPGIFYCLRAKYYFVSSYISDINFWFSGSTILVNLWHGIILKKIEFDITKGTLAERYHNKNWYLRLYNRIIFPHLFRKPSYLSASSEYTAEIMSKAFRIKKENCIVSGMPRTDLLFMEKEEVRKKLSDDLTQGEFLPLLEEIENCSKVIIYMPTWRDNNPEFIRDSGICFTDINDLCARKNFLFLMKFHPNTKMPDEEFNYSHIRFLKNNFDIYYLLNYTDLLITDYSSIFFDYLLTGKDLLFYPFDLEEYLSSSRKMYFDYNTIMPAKKTTSFDQLKQLLEDDDLTFKNENYEIIRNKFWGKNIKNASEYITRFVREMKFY